MRKLTSIDELERCLERSRQLPVWIFKHSLACGISASALDEFRRFVEGATPGEMEWALIEVQTARDVSSELARRTGVRHETPQALLLRDGEVQWHESHWRIRAESLRRRSETTPRDRGPR